MNANNVASVLAHAGDLRKHERVHAREKRYKRKPKGNFFRNKKSVRKHEKALGRSKSASEHEVQIHRPCTRQEHSSNQGENYSCWLCQEELCSEELLLAHYQNHMTFEEPST